MGSDHLVNTEGDGEGRHILLLKPLFMSSHWVHISLGSNNVYTSLTVLCWELYLKRGSE